METIHIFNNKVFPFKQYYSIGDDNGSIRKKLLYLVILFMLPIIMFNSQKYMNKEFVEENAKR